MGQHSADAASGKKGTWQEIPLEGLAEQNQSSAGALGQISDDEQALMSRIDELEAQEAAAEAAAQDQSSCIETSQPSSSKQDVSKPRQQGSKYTGKKPSLRHSCVEVKSHKKLETH